MAFDEALVDRIRCQLARHNRIEEKNMFGGICFFRHGNIVVGVWKDSLIARFGPGESEAALQVPFVREFDITGKAMNGGQLCVSPDYCFVPQSRLEAFIHRCKAVIAEQFPTVQGNPDFVAWGRAFGMQAERIDRRDQIGPVLECAFAAPGPCLIEVASRLSGAPPRGDRQE